MPILMKAKNIFVKKHILKNFGHFPEVYVSRTSHKVGMYEICRSFSKYYNSPVVSLSRHRPACRSTNRELGRRPPCHPLTHWLGVLALRLLRLSNLLVIAHCRLLLAQTRDEKWRKCCGYTWHKIFRCFDTIKNRKIHQTPCLCHTIAYNISQLYEILSKTWSYRRPESNLQTFS